MTGQISIVVSKMKACHIIGINSNNKIHQSSLQQSVVRMLSTPVSDDVASIKIHNNSCQKMIASSPKNQFVSGRIMTTDTYRQQQYQLIRQYNTSTYVESSSSTGSSSNRHVEAKPLLRLNTIVDSTQIHTKIVCTIGPASDTKEQMQQLMNNGMAVARLNFSHAGDDYTYANHCFNLIRSAPGIHSKIAAVIPNNSSNSTSSTTSTTDGDESDSNSTTSSTTGSMNNAFIPNVRAVLVDTKGPEIRTGPLPGNEKVLSIFPGQIVKLYTDRDIVSNSPIPQVQTDTFSLNVDYMNIARTLQIGNQVLLDDGLIALQVIDIDITNSTVTTKALNGGPILANKGVNLPGVQLDLPALTEKDKRDLLWACEVGADFVAASFIRTADNVRSVIAYLDRCVATIREKQEANYVAGSSSAQPSLIRPLVISKIESQEGVENFDEILEESDGIMVARGDVSFLVLLAFCVCVCVIHLLT
jgi:pyruvate kinase